MVIVFFFLFFLFFPLFLSLFLYFSLCLFPLPHAVPLVEFLFLLEHRASRCLAVITRHDKAPLFQAPLDFSPLFLLPILVPPFHTLLNGRKDSNTAGSDVSTCARSVITFQPSSRNRLRIVNERLEVG